jgi:molecular chaperone GrpE
VTADGREDRGATGTAADTAEPVGDQDPAVEAERTAETDRLHDVDAARAADGPPGAEPDEIADQPGGDQLERTEAERDEYLALAQRTQADFDNYRKRAARDVAAAGARAKAELVRAILPAVDNLERALASAEKDEGGLAEGVRLVLAELVGALERSGVTTIEPAGEPFDPNLHEALSTRSENGAEPGVVLDVVQKGYRLEGTILRPARVVVSA